MDNDQYSIIAKHVHNAVWSLLRNYHADIFAFDVLLPEMHRSLRAFRTDGLLPQYVPPAVRDMALIFGKLYRENRELYMFGSMKAYGITIRQMDDSGLFSKRLYKGKKRNGRTRGWPTETATKYATRIVATVLDELPPSVAAQFGPPDILSQIILCNRSNRWERRKERIASQC